MPQWEHITLSDFALAATSFEKNRFEFQAGHVRARYGHSVGGRMRFESATPPPLLFHGTTPRAATRILVEGLEPRSRQYVHLSSGIATARAVGGRRCADPVILRVDTATAITDGVEFFSAGDGVWLTTRVPVAALSEERIRTPRDINGGLADPKARGPEGASNGPE